MKAHLRICALFQVTYSNLKRVVVLSLSYRCLIVALLLSDYLLDNYWTTIGQRLDNDWTTTGTGCAGRCGSDGVDVEVDLEGGVAAVVEELLAGHQQVLAHLTGVEGGLYLEHKLADVLLFDLGY